jgi:two-component system chemotaxis response regulator CheB
MNPANRIVALGGSVGSIQAVSRLLAALPATFAAAILVVIHTSEESPGLLPQIFRRHSHMPVIPASHQPLEAGKAYIAVPGKHLVVTQGAIHVTDGPRENRNRPAIDPMLRSLAKAYQERAIGVVLSGYLDDGTAGLVAIKQYGGIAIVQDPEEAQAPSMPLSALANLHVDHVASLRKLPELLQQLVSAPPPQPPMQVPASTAEKADSVAPSVYTCPECHGTLWEVHTGGLLRFECRVGHTYSSESMLLDQTEASERALWAALRSLEEGAQLARRLMQRATEMKQGYGVERFRQRAEAAEEHIRELRRMLGRGASEGDTDREGQAEEGDDDFVVNLGA